MTRRSLLDIAVRVAATPAGVAFFANWTRAEGQHQHSTNAEAPPESAILRAAKHPAYFAYRLIKRENTFAFYTARAGMIETLDYRGNSYNLSFPACNHPEHHAV